MGQLLARFLVYAKSVLDALKAIKGRVAANYTELNGKFNNLNDIVTGLGTRVTDNYTEFTTFMGTVPTLISTALQAAKDYTDFQLSQINFNVFGGRTKEQWESFISTTAADLVASEEARVNAMKETSDTRIIKLEDFATAEIALSAIAAPAPAVGNASTHLLKFQAPLGATNVTRTITGLPGTVDTLTVDNGDEIFLSYDVTGVASYVVFNDSEAQVVSSILGAQAVQAQEIAAQELVMSDLGQEFLTEAAKIDLEFSTF